jgi:thioredoxin reductase (NADPH)
MLTTDVENYPGFPDGVTGPDMMEKFQKQAERFGTRVLLQDITSIDFSDDPIGNPHTLHTSKGETVRAHAVIISTGATANWLGPRERAAARPDRRRRERLRRLRRRPADVPEAPLAVVGGGDTAMEEATYLTKFASKVYVIHRRDELRASKVMQERLLSKPNAEVLWNKTVVDCLSAPDDHGNDKLTASCSRTRRPASGASSRSRGCSSRSATRRRRSSSGPGSSSTTRATSSSRAAQRDEPARRLRRGRCRRREYRQAVTAAGMGCQAALDAEHWLGAHDLV